MAQAKKRANARTTRKKLNPYQLHMRNEIAAIKAEHPTYHHRLVWKMATTNWHSS
jgi:hypothetical protein